MSDEFAVMAGQIPPDAPDYPGEHTRHAWIETEGLTACALCGIDKARWLTDPIDCASYRSGNETIEAPAALLGVAYPPLVPARPTDRLVAHHAARDLVVEVVRDALRILADATTAPQSPRSDARLEDAKRRVNVVFGALDASVVAAIADGGLRVGDGVWTSRSWDGREVGDPPLTVGQSANGDLPTDVREDGTVAYSLATVWLTQDGGLVGSVDHEWDWSEDGKTRLDDGLGSVRYERWTGFGFQMSGTCHPVSRGLVAVGEVA